MKIPSYSVILVFVALMVIGVALVPGLDVGVEPTPRQGSTLTINYDWQGQPAKVVEQSLTSVVEGLLSSVEGVGNISSTSYFGRSEINVTLKDGVDISSARFEVASILRQSYPKLPKGVSYPSLTGGEASTGKMSEDEETLLLTWQVNADMPPEKIKSLLENGVVRQLRGVDGVSRVEVAGVTGRYVEVSYNPDVLVACGLKAEDIANGIRSWLGRDDAVGTVTVNGKDVIAVRLTTPKLSRPMEDIPIGNVGGKTVFLGNLAQARELDRDPDSYYRVNGLETVYLNIYMPASGKAIATSDRVQERMADIKAETPKGMSMRMTYDAAEKQRVETSKLVSRTLLSLAILLILVLVTSRDWRYTIIIAFALAASLLLAVIAFRTFGIRLHVYSLAGITVSLGLIIDSTIVMADHYSYYHDRRAFLSILAATTTTVGALVVVFFLPKELRNDLWDFSLVVIINLVAGLLVALFFVPALIDQTGYKRKERTSSTAFMRVAAGWNRLYRGYLRLTSRHRWIYYCILVAAVVPALYYLPKSMDKDNDSHNEEEKELHIMAQMPVGGTATQLNAKVRILEEFLKTKKQEGIKEFTTRIDGGGGEITVTFEKNKANGSFPYRLENEVIGKVIGIGGADWATWGVSERGFSNSLDLQHRDNTIRLSGYNYDQLYRLAEKTADYMSGNVRVRDITIQTPGHENQEDEFFMRYDLSRASLYGITPSQVHQRLRDMLSDDYVGIMENGDGVDEDVELHPVTADSYDLWHLNNAQIQVDSANVLTRDLMKIESREAKNVIPRENQEYVLDIAFNILGSYTYADNYMKQALKHISKSLPVGFQCKSPQWETEEEPGTKWWLIALIGIVIFWVCAVHFNSLRLPLVIISILPVSLIGVFLTFRLTGVEFGSGGFASLVLLMGITVNSGIYILSQYRIIRNSSGKSMNPLSCYLHAYNHKIIPVLLTILSTIAGLLPFFFDGSEEPFWFSFATGVTGGLLFSIPTLVFVMPLFISFQIK